MEKIISPCNGFCEMNTRTGYCKGCARTMEEIMNWQKYSDPQRIRIMQQLDNRLKKSNS